MDDLIKILDKLVNSNKKYPNNQIRFGKKFSDELILNKGSFGKIIYTICDKNQCHSYDFRYDGHNDYIPKKLSRAWIYLYK